MKLHGRKFFDFGFGNATDYYDIIDRSGAPTPPMLRYDDVGGDDDNDDYFSTGPTSTSSSSSISFKGMYSTTVFQERAMEVSGTPSCVFVCVFSCEVYCFLGEFRGWARVCVCFLGVFFRCEKANDSCRRVVI